MNTRAAKRHGNALSTVRKHKKLNKRFKKNKAPEQMTDYDMIEQYMTAEEVRPSDFARRIGMTSQGFNQMRVRGTVSKNMLAVIARELNMTIEEFLARKRNPQAVNVSRLQRALIQLHKALGSSTIDQDCLTTAVVEVDKVIARKRKRLESEDKALLYRAVYDVALHDKQIAENEVRKIIEGILKRGGQ